VGLVVVALEGAQDALVGEAEALERALGAVVLDIDPGPEPLHAQRLEGNPGEQRLRLISDSRAPELTAQPDADHAAPVAQRDLEQRDDPDRAVGGVGDRELERDAVKPVARQRCDPLGGLGLLLVRPQENGCVTSGSLASSNRRGASAARG